MFDELVYVLSYKLLPVAEELEEYRSIRASQPALHIVVTCPLFQAVLARS